MNKKKKIKGINKVLSDSSTTTISEINSEYNLTDQSNESENNEYLESELKQKIINTIEKKNIEKKSCFIVKSLLNNSDITIDVNNNNNISDSSESEISSIDSISYLK